MLSGRRAVMITGQIGLLRQAPEAAAEVVARLEPGVVAALLSCAEGIDWCRVEVGRIAGWLPRRGIWGVFPGETVK